MPTERFFHLPKEKQKRIIKASIHEFARVGFDQVSINRIIQEADISRGSFYQYFEDKTDLQNFLLRDFVDSIKSALKVYTENESGDLVQFSKDVLDATIRASKDENCQAVCYNMFSRMKYGNSAFEDLFFTIRKEHILSNILTFMQKKYYPNATMEELQLILEILFSQIKECIAEIMIYKKPVDEARTKFMEKIDLIESGIKSKENKNA